MTCDLTADGLSELPELHSPGRSAAHCGCAAFPVPTRSLFLPLDDDAEFGIRILRGRKQKCGEVSGNSVAPLAGGPVCDLRL